MIRKFLIQEHPEYGTVGFAPTWMSGEQSDPLTGMGVAHDILEHGSKDVCEWQGLGGSVYVRGEDYYRRRAIGNTDPAANLGSEFHNLFHLWHGADIPDPGRTTRLPEEWAETMIQDCVAEGCRQTIAGSGYSDHEDQVSARHWTREEQRRRMVGWMRKGYRAAARRWAEIPPYKMLETFIQIETCVDSFLKEYGDCKGAHAIVAFNPWTEAVTVYLEEDPDY